MSDSSNALARAREWFATPGRVFAGREAGVVLAAGRDPAFNPAGNVVDAMIHRFLVVTYGPRWRETSARRSVGFSAGNPHAGPLVELAAAAEAARLRYDAVVDERLAIQGRLAVAYRDSQVVERPGIGYVVRRRIAESELKELERRADELERLQPEVAAAAERATGRVNSARLLAARWEEVEAHTAAVGVGKS